MSVCSSQELPRDLSLAQDLVSLVLDPKVSFDAHLSEKYASVTCADAKTAVHHHIVPSSLESDTKANIYRSCTLEKAGYALRQCRDPLRKYNDGVMAVMKDFEMSSFNAAMDIRRRIEEHVSEAHDLLDEIKDPATFSPEGAITLSSCPPGGGSRASTGGQRCAPACASVGAMRRYWPGDKQVLCVQS